MAVGFHAAGSYQPSFGFDHLYPLRDLQFRPHGGDPAIIPNKQIPPKQFLPDNWFYVSVSDQQHMPYLVSFLFSIAYSPVFCKKYSFKLRDPLPE